MAYLNTTFAPTLSDRIGGLVTTVKTRYRQHRLYRETVDGLSALTDRDLADLGITRCGIRRVAAETSLRG